MDVLFLNVGLATSILGLVGVFIRMPNIGLTTRRRGYVWMATGAALMIAAGVMMATGEAFVPAVGG